MLHNFRFLHRHTQFVEEKDIAEGGKAEVKNMKVYKLGL